MKRIFNSKRDRLPVKVCVFLITAALIVGMAGCVGPYNLTIASTAGGSVTVPGEGTFAYDEETIVDLVAEADEGYQFVNWTGNVSAIADVYDASTTITMNGDYSITANFAIAIEIWDWHDLDAVRNNLGGSYILMNDLDFTTAGYEELASPTANGEKGWQPIGTNDDPFTGTFDGQGFEIRDLFINRPDEDDVGLFSALDQAGVIKNIGLTNATMIGQDRVGGLAGENEGTVSNSYYSGSVTGISHHYHVGGLVGGNGGTVTNSYSTGSVTGESFVGGLVGTNVGTVSNSYSSSSVIGSSYLIGGLVGVSEGIVTNSYSTGNVTGNSCIGGLVGANGYSVPGTVSNSYSTGSVTGESYVGGLVGGNEGGTVTDSYSIGNVTGVDNVGGLVGENLIDGDVSNSYSTGSVTGESYVGGLVGWNEGCDVSNSYSTGNVTGDESVGGLVGLNFLRTVSNSYSTGSVTGESYVGGLVGWNEAGSVSNSYSTGSVTGNSSVGGLVGINPSGGTVSNSYSTCSVTGNVYVGGLVGEHWGTVTNSYSTGNVAGDVHVGGLVGAELGSSTVSNSFWDTQTSGQATSDGGTGKNTTEMKNIATFSGATWDIVAVANADTRNPAYIWNIVDDETYPFLSWQP